MTMTNSSQPNDTSPVSRGHIARTLLWTLVVISAIANMVASFVGDSTWPHVVCGAVSVLCVGVLVAGRLRKRPDQ
ncbi:hypothetical protein GCM10022222_67090 [Amycolatopsis ultiminotia]|uniref:MYXO-CTERM domain-containing protein n=1 Tax=Amycolatopsis ultiminotia TaxID=543629 RepID=A0ABP6XYB5_9PSEU